MLSAILPIFFLILLGYVLKTVSIFSNPFWDGLERLAYYVLFPCLLISKMATADLSAVDLVPLAGSLWLGLIGISLLTLAFKPFVGLSDVSFTSFFQGTIRFNTYIGLALTDGLFGTQGLVIAVILAALLIPPINVFVVIVLQVYGENTKASILQTVYAVAQNPLILGCVIGIGINVSGIDLSLALSQIILSTVSIIGSSALPIGLLCVGAALILKSLDKLPTLLIASALKLLVYPIMAWYLSGLFDLDLLTRQIIVLFCALPTASASYVLAKSMGGDHAYMARIITFQVLLSLASLMLIFPFIGIDLNL